MMKPRTKDLIIGWLALLAFTVVVLLVIGALYLAYSKSLAAGIAITALIVVGILVAEK